MKPEVWMIQMPDNPRSMYYRGRTEMSWIDRGYDLKFFEATTPENNTKSFLNFGLKRDTIEFTPTEIAVWYSHVEMWAKARSKPIIIVEHDAMLLEPIPEELFEHEMVCLGHTTKRKTLLPGLAYFLTPHLATRMVADVKNTKKITWNSDGSISSYNVKYGHTAKDYVFQIKNSSIGTTIEHRKK